VRSKLSIGLAIAVAVPAGRAMALRIENGDNPIELDFTEDAAFDYHFAHGNGNIAGPATLPNGNVNFNYDPTSDNYLDWINRFETQFSMGSWHADLRFDSALFANAPQVSDVSSKLGTYLAGLLQNRYVNNFELEKVSASYTSAHLDATVGDFYLSYGRGLVVSLRKIDALGVDTTLFGGTVTARTNGFSANLAGGVTNTTNTDPSTGEVAPDPNDPIVAGRLEYRLKQLFAVGVDGAILWQNRNVLDLTYYQPGQTSLKQYPISLLGFGSVTAATSLPPRTVTQNYSATFELPNLWNHGSAYAELVHQFQQDNPTIQTQGNGLYAGVNLYEGDFTLQAEFKDYSYFEAPTFSSLSPVAFTAFSQQDVYNNPPNLEEIWQEETTTDNTYGPRLRLDWQVSEHFKPYLAFLYFVDKESAYNIYTGSSGLDANWQQHRSHLAFSGGYRREVFNDQSASTGGLHAAEFWLQYDLIQVLTNRYALELDGLHRTHLDQGPLLWDQGYAYLSLRHSRFSASVGIEYYTYATNEYQPWYPNASGSYNINRNLLVRAFVGGREAGLRCINGICRNYPGFNGGTLEIVAKY